MNKEIESCRMQLSLNHSFPSGPLITGARFFRLNSLRQVPFPLVEPV